MGINEKAWGIGFKRMIGDPSLGNGETYGICVDETVRQIHICDIGDSGTDWARSVSSHPELCIHSATTPETYYLKMYSAGATAYIDAVGATTLSILIAGTAELALTSSAFSPGVTNSSALGTSSLQWSDLFLASGAVITFSDDLTITHNPTGGGKLTVASTWDTAAATGRPFLVQLNVDNVRLGGYANALKAYVVCDESGSSQGVLSSANFEISMPSTGGGEGVYTCTEHEMVCPSGYNSTGCIASFMYFNSAGDGEAEFDSTGYFFHIDTGISATAAKILSADSQTLRVGLGANASTARYLVMSQVENILYTNVSAVAAVDGHTARFMGTSATPDYADGTAAFEVQLNVSGQSAGHTNAASCWINLGGSSQIDSYLTEHTDGIYDGGATLTTAKIAWAKYTCMLASNPAQSNIIELNFSGSNSALDAIFNVNNAALALGLVVGDHPDDTPYGSIPFYTVAGGTVKYIRVYTGTA